MPAWPKDSRTRTASTDPAGRRSRSHCANDPELVDPAIQGRKDEGLQGLTVPGAWFTSWEPEKKLRTLGNPCGSIPMALIGLSRRRREEGTRSATHRKAQVGGRHQIESGTHPKLTRTTSRLRLLRLRSSPRTTRLQVKSHRGRPDSGDTRSTPPNPTQVMPASPRPPGPQHGAGSTAAKGGRLQEGGGSGPSSQSS